VRKIGLLTTFLASLLVLPLSVFALGLGEIEVNSYLNQPLKAEISVISARPDEVDDLLVSLGSRDAFQKAGLERPAGLLKIRFQVNKSDDGQSATISVTTKTPVKEPFLNFLVEADWAKGRLLREFTVLLDPPYFAQQAEEKAAATLTDQTPKQSPAEESVSDAASNTSTGQQQDTSVIAQPIATNTTDNSTMSSDQSSEPQTQDPVTTTAEEQYAGDSGSTAITSFSVSKGDTLWGIASGLKDDTHSMGQIMLALQAMNPDAFGQENINNLKVGAVLRVPDMETLNRLNKQEAYAQVLEQNGLWDEYVARKTGAVAGSPKSTGAGGNSDAGTSTQLSLLAPGDGDSTNASLQADENSEDAGLLRKQLALAEEELEAAKLENTELSTRIANLESQLSKIDDLQKLVQIEDNSLAQIQTEAAKADDKPSDTMVAAADALMTDDSTTSEAETDDGMKDETEIAEDAMSESTLSTEAETVIETVEESTDDMIVEEPKDEPVQEVASTSAAPIIISEPSSATSMDVDTILGMLPTIDEIMADPTLLGGIGGVLILLLVLLFVKRKKPAEESDEVTISLDESDDTDDDSSDETPIHIPSEAGDSTDDQDELTDEVPVVEAADSDEQEEEDEFDRTAILSADDMAEADQGSADEDQDDVLNEVDVYLAYGLYDNAEDLLNDSLQTSPDRADYRAKLLDTYFATKNKDGFVKEAERLKSLGGGADKHWGRIQVMGYELAPENELFSEAKDSDVTVADLEYSKPDAADFDIGAEEDSTDFSNTDFDLSDDTDNDPLNDTQVVSPAGAESFDATQTLDDDQTQMPDFEIGGDELPDDIGDEILLDEPDDDLSEELSDNAEDDDALDFDLPDDLELSSDSDEEVIDLDLDVDDVLDSDEDLSSESDGIDLELDADEIVEVDDVELDDVELDLGDLSVDMDSTEEVEDDLDSEEPDSDIMDIDLGVDESLEDEIEIDLDSGLEPELETDEDDLAFDVSDEEEEGDFEKTVIVSSDLDLDMNEMESAGLQTGTFSVADDITDFNPASEIDNIEEELGESAGLDEVAEEVDLEAAMEDTGTFAPGDFDNTSEQEDSLETSIDEDSVEGIEDLMLPDDVDEVSTKLDLAKAFIDMGDAEGAKSSLEEVLVEGNDDQKSEATELMNQIS